MIDRQEQARFMAQDTLEIRDMVQKMANEMASSLFEESASEITFPEGAAPLCISFSDDAITEDMATAYFLALFDVSDMVETTRKALASNDHYREHRGKVFTSNLYLSSFGRGFVINHEKPFEFFCFGLDRPRRITPLVIVTYWLSSLESRDDLGSAVRVEDMLPTHLPEPELSIHVVRLCHGADEVLDACLRSIRETHAIDPENILSVKPIVL